jgi:murein L,D-transpeptidase YafK
MYLKKIKMPVLILFMFFFPVYAFSDYDLVDLYRAKGINLVAEKIEEKLKNQKYWAKRLMSQDVSFGYFENINYLFLSDKSVPSIDLYKYSIKDKKFIFLDAVKAFVGKNRGIKTKEGDEKTPVGVYFLEKRLNKLDPFYGPLAFTTSYPNIYDKVLGRTGSGIWIHGLPLNNKDREDFTRGCIAIENIDILRFDKKIQSNLEKSVLVITHKKLQKVKISDLSIILASLYQWLDAWRFNNFEKYISFYSEKFIKYNGQKYEDFVKFKKYIFSKNEQKEIYFTDINIIPYPNPEERNIFYINFNEVYKSPSHVFDGLKELYVEIIDNEFYILVEK